MLGLAVAFSFIMPPTCTMAFFSLNKIRGHKQHCPSHMHRFLDFSRVPNREADKGKLLHRQSVNCEPVLTASLGIVSGAGESQLYTLTWSQLVVVCDREV